MWSRPRLNVVWVKLCLTWVDYIRDSVVITECVTGSHLVFSSWTVLWAVDDLILFLFFSILVKSSSTKENFSERFNKQTLPVWSHPKKVKFPLRSSQTSSSQSQVHSLCNQTAQTDTVILWDSSGILNWKAEASLSCENKASGGRRLDDCVSLQSQINRL